MAYLTLLDGDNVKPYAVGHFISHIVALRINSTPTNFGERKRVPLLDIVVTDYTSNKSLVGERHHVPSSPLLRLKPEECLHLTISLALFETLCDNYKAVAGEELFTRQTADLEKGGWIDVPQQLCVARLDVRFRRKGEHLCGFVSNVGMLHLLEHLGVFWRRFVERAEPLMRTRPKVLIRILKAMGPQALSALADLVEKLAKLTAHRIKAEHSDESDGENTHWNALEPELSQVSELPARLLVMLKPLQAPREQDRPRDDKRDELQLLTQVPDDSWESPPRSRSANFVTLGELNALKPQANRVYKTRAMVVGCTPGIEYACVKVYKSENGKLVLRDPAVQPLAFVLADGQQQALGPHNSSIVHVKRENILAFFGAKYPEQLYTRVEKHKEAFASKSLRYVELQLLMLQVDSVPAWTAYNWSFSHII